MRVFEVTGWQGNVGQSVDIQANSARQAISVFRALFPGEQFASFSVDGYPVQIF
jgi:hypothetical protein